MNAFVSAGAGFLLAVLWFDLMFDVQVRAHRAGDLPEVVLASIAAYYARVTTAAKLMSRLVAVVMLATLAGVVAQILGDDTPAAVAWLSLALLAFAILLAGGRVLPNAVRLGTRDDTIERQSALARAIFRDHALCFVSIAALLALQLAAA